MIPTDVTDSCGLCVDPSYRLPRSLATRVPKHGQFAHGRLGTTMTHEGSWFRDRAGRSKAARGKHQRENTRADFLACQRGYSWTLLFERQHVRNNGKCAEFGHNRRAFRRLLVRAQVRLHRPCSHSAALPEAQRQKRPSLLNATKYRVFFFSRLIGKQKRLEPDGAAFSHFVTLIGNATSVTLPRWCCHDIDLLGAEEALQVVSA